MGDGDSIDMNEVIEEDILEIMFSVQKKKVGSSSLSEKNSVVKDVVVKEEANDGDNQRSPLVFVDLEEFSKRKRKKKVEDKTRPENTVPKEEPHSEDEGNTSAYLTPKKFFKGKSKEGAPTPSVSTPGSPIITAHPSPIPPTETKDEQEEDGLVRFKGRVFRKNDLVRALEPRYHYHGSYYPVTIKEFLKKNQVIVHWEEYGPECDQTLPLANLIYRDELVFFGEGETPVVGEKVYVNNKAKLTEPSGLWPGVVTEVNEEERRATVTLGDKTSKSVPFMLLYKRPAN
eukprot:TRINITY_DN1064_c0_g1_i1.p1 TRINITY_DN1064_c0_g1~~TRINITY_DN1064_c0_g1_i1.p1  ORF type:complete len:287 (-),score=62.89 TRINITY_DN1064_c0_g1_i1:162-1022(-)